MNNSESESLKAQYDRDGYLIRKGAFDPREIELLYGLAVGDNVLLNNALDLNDQSGKRTKLTLWFTPGDDAYGILTRIHKTLDIVKDLFV